MEDRYTTFTDSAMKPVCADEEESTEHVVFTCPRFETYRGDFASAIGNNSLSVDNIIDQMLKLNANWNEFIMYIQESRKKEEELRKRALERN